MRVYSELLLLRLFHPRQNLTALWSRIRRSKGSGHVEGKTSTGLAEQNLAILREHIVKQTFGQEPSEPGSSSEGQPRRIR